MDKTIKDALNSAQRSVDINEIGHLYYAEITKRKITLVEEISLAAGLLGSALISFGLNITEEQMEKYLRESLFECISRNVRQRVAERKEGRPPQEMN